MSAEFRQRPSQILTLGAPSDLKERVSLSRSVVAEGLGTSFLLMAVVGSGIMGERLSGGNIAIALLANSLATGAALYMLIKWLAPLSGAHLNPLITLMLAFRGDISRRAAAAYVAIQMVGAIAGVALANTMFELPVFSISTHNRSGAANLLGEFVATFGLVGLVWTCSRWSPPAVPSVVAAYISSAFWFTPTDFANPAVTLARTLTNTFSGIRPADVYGFIGAEIAGAVCAVLLFQWMTRFAPK